MDHLRYELVEDETLIELAVLCDTALVEANGALSVVRIINRMFPPFPDMPYVSRRIDLALILIEGRNDTGTHTIRLDLIAPDGARQEGASNEFMFPENQQSLTQVFGIDFNGDQNGVYWFELFIDDRVRKRIPLQVWIPALPGDAAMSEGDQSEYGVGAV